MTADRLPRWANVRVTLGDKTTRVGHVVVDYGERVLVEYQSAAGYFQARTLKRAAVELLPTTLCGAAGTRNRVCAAATGHVGDHTFVLRTEREGDEPHKYANEYEQDAVEAAVQRYAELAADDAAAEEAYRDMQAHPETVVDAQDLF